MEEIFGFVDHIIYADEEKGFTVARLKEPKKKDPTCIVGVLPAIQPGETMRCKGQWKNHPQYGIQFEVKIFEVEAPSDLVGIQKYLESGMIKGIGPVYAERIVKQFGVNTLAVIDQAPDRLREVAGLGEKRIEKIRDCWDSQKTIRQVMVFLRGHGVSPSFAQKIFRAYGERSIEKVKENPYALAKEIYGIGFKSADSIAKGMGIASDSSLRMEAGIEFALWELTNEGHVCYPEAELIPYAAALLEVEEEKVARSVETLVEKGHVVRDEKMLAVKPLFLAEMGIARELKRLVEVPCALRAIDEIKALEWVQGKLHIQLAEQQMAAVLYGVKDKVQIITGGPGTGKSTITKAILAISEKLSTKILLAAPTGRAAKRMNEITHKKAFTIHSLLEMNLAQGGFKRGKDNPLECDLLIIDEASMIDTLLMYSLLKAIPSHARVIFVGDIDQLPSVGAGNVLKDMIQSKALRTTQLTKIFRQAEGSRIVTNAHKINKGEFPDLRPMAKSDFAYLLGETPEEILHTIRELVSSRLPRSYHFDRLEHIQVLSPMKRGLIGIENLNTSLQQLLNPDGTGVVRQGRRYLVGDKVMQMRNNYQKCIFNGDVGRIESIDEEEQKVIVLIDERRIEYDMSELDELQLAYAVSIHKYQGSECPCIVIPIHTSHFKLLTRNLLYTGITRGKKLVVLVGSKKAIALAVHNQEVASRHTRLTARIQEFFPAASGSPLEFAHPLLEQRAREEHTAIDLPAALL